MDNLTTHTNGVRINDHLLAEIKAAKMEMFNYPKLVDFSHYLPKKLSVQSTVYPWSIPKEDKKLLSK